jgi:hypothetical protein
MTHTIGIGGKYFRQEPRFARWSFELAAAARFLPRVVIFMGLEIADFTFKKRETSFKGNYEF